MSDSKNEKPVDTISVIADIIEDVADIFSGTPTENPLDTPAEKYIKKYIIPSSMTDYEKTLVSGNIRSFYSEIR